MDRLTAKAENGMAYLVKVKLTEQEVESPFPNTLRAILESFNRLAAYEDTALTPEEIMALKAENQKRDEGCEFCCFTEYQDATLYPRDNDVFYAGYSEQIEVDKFNELEIDKIHFCPQCGRKLEVSND